MAKHKCFELVKRRFLTSIKFRRRKNEIECEKSLFFWKCLHLENELYVDCSAIFVKKIRGYN